MPVISGFGVLAELPWERVTDKIERRVLAGQQGMIVWWKMKAGAHAAAHRHPHEQIVNVLSGSFVMHVGDQVHELGAGDTLVIPSEEEHSAEAITDVTCLDVFTPVREDYRKVSLCSQILQQ